MKYEGDPPRLREFPDETGAALGVAIDELGGAAPTVQDLAMLRGSVRMVLGLAPIASHPPISPAPPGNAVGGGASAAKGLLIAKGVTAAKSSVVAGQWLSLIVVPLGVGAVAGAIALGAARSLERARTPAPAQTTFAPAALDRRAPAEPEPRAVGSTAPRDEPPLATTRPERKPARTASAANDSAPRIELPLPPLLTHRDDVLPPQKETEVGLLTRAQEALDRDPAVALDLTREHEGRFADALLAQEREVIAIEALVRLGRAQEAEVRAARFHARFPYSAHGRRIDVLLHAPR